MMLNASQTVASTPSVEYQGEEARYEQAEAGNSPDQLGR